jgi:protein NrfD
MDEITTTRSNELIDPSIHIWGWEVGVYLFLGGLVAGMMIISGYFIFKGRHNEHTCSCFRLPLLGVILLSVGMFALFLDLEYKVHVWRMYATFQIASPMSWGSWILILVYPALIANILLRPAEWMTKRTAFIKTWSEKINQYPVIFKSIGGTNIVLGIMLGIYTGVLLSAFGARPLWNSSILGILFLVSGLSSAAALVHMIAKNTEERILLAKADVNFLIIELVIIGLWIIGLISSTEVHLRGAMLILNGPYAASFWVLIVFIGVIIPIIMQSLAVRNKIHHYNILPIMVMFGGLMLRFVIVFAGQYSHWTKNI